MPLFDTFATALPFDAFLDRYGAVAHRDRWRQVLEQVALTPAQQKLLGTFPRTMNVLVLAGAWCGDCASQCPIFERFARACPVLDIRYLDNGDHPDIQRELCVNGGNRVPVVVFFSEDGHEAGRYGDRTLSKYRALVEQLVGESCASGIVTGGDPLLVRVTQDWLNEFERVQWLLRLSPRLRQLHRD